MKSKIHELKNDTQHTVSKTLCMLLIALGLQVTTASASSYTEPDRPNPTESSWTKSEKGTWLGGYRLWYKFDKKNKEVKFSHNKRRWNTASNAAWQDKQGNWLFIYEGKLMNNVEGTWTEVKNKTWQDLNGNWYRLNQNWELEETAAQESMAASH